MAKSRRAYKSAKRSKELNRLRKQEKKRLRRQGRLKEEPESSAETNSGQSDSTP